MVTQTEMNNIKRHLNSSINDANELLQECKSMEIKEINIGMQRKYRGAIDEL